LIFFIVFACAIDVIAQQAADTVFRGQAIKNLIQFYHQSIGFHAELYNGPQPEPYLTFTEGDPYFTTSTFSSGTIRYNGLIYQEVPILYDLVRDELVIRHPNGDRFSVFMEKVDSFSFSGHYFIKLKIDSTTSPLTKSSFYEKLFSGRIMLLARNRKFIQEQSGTTSFERKIYERNQYYVLKDGKYYPVKNKKSLLAVLKDKRNELQQYIKKNNLEFRNNFKADMSEVVAYYDQLL